MLSEAVQVSVFEFLSAIIVGLAWPAVAAFLVWQQRAPIERLIDRFRALGFGDLKANFDRPMAAAEALAASPDPTPAKAEPESASMTGTSTSPTIGGPAKPTPSREDQSAMPSGADRLGNIRFKMRDPFNLLARTDPKAAINQVWRQVQRKLDDLNERTGGTAVTYTDVLAQGVVLDVLQPKALLLHKDLGDAHTASLIDPSVSTSDAVRFRNSAEQLLDMIESATGPWENALKAQKLRNENRN